MFGLVSPVVKGIGDRSAVLLWLEHQDDSGGSVNPRNTTSRITVPVLLIGSSLDGEAAPTGAASDHLLTGHPGLAPGPAKTTNSAE
jgi:hypothetical protein